MFKNKRGETSLGLVIGIGAIIVLGMYMMNAKDTTPAVTAPVVPVAPSAAAGSGQCELAPTYTYQGRDDLNGQTLPSGYGSMTVQAKSNGARPSTSTTPVAGKPLSLWMQSTKNYTCKISEIPAADCGNQLLENQCYFNATSVTMTFYEEPAHTAQTATTVTGGGATNVSVGSNGLGTLSLTIQGIAKQAYAPFGGCLAIELPNSVTSVTVPELTAGCPYPITYSVSSTSNIYKLFTIPEGFDKFDGAASTIHVNFQNGGTDIANANLIARIYPVNNYIDLTGNFVKGIEKDKNGDTTKTGLLQPMAAIGLS